MELRRICICLAVVVLVALTQTTESKHTLQRREADDDVNYDDTLQGDEGNNDETQNDETQNDEEDDEDEIINGTILNPSEHYTAIIGKAIQLSCKVSPPEGLVIEWYKDGEKIFLSRNNLKNIQRYSIAPGSTDLLIKDLQPSDMGKYKCLVVQTPPAFIEHTVAVTEAPRITSFTASDHGVLVEGSDLLLTCDVAGLPKPEILWSRVKNGQSEKLTEKHGTFSSNTFFARNVNKEMSGNYLCYAINSVGHNEANVTVKVMGKPRVFVPRTIINSDIGVEAVLQCSAHDEDPAPHIRWYKDDALIEDSSTQYTISTHGSNSNLSVTPQVDQDFGTFTCEAENNHGKHSRSIDLVQSPVVEDFDVDGPKITWKTLSHQPLEEIQLQLKNINSGGEWKIIQVPLPQSDDEKKHEYNIVYELNGIDDGKYETNVKIKNAKSWSSFNDPRIVEFETQAQPIQTASVFRGSLAGDGHSTRPAAILSTIFIYLLVRML